MTDLLEDPEDVNRAQHRIASTNQHATNMDNMSHNVVGAVWRWGMREKWSKIKPKSRTREASVEVLAVLDQPHSLGLLPEATVLDVPLGLYPCEVERKRDVFNSETRWLRERRGRHVCFAIYSRGFLGVFGLWSFGRTPTGGKGKAKHEGTCKISRNCCLP